MNAKEMTDALKQVVQNMPTDEDGHWFPDSGYCRLTPEQAKMIEECEGVKLIELTPNGTGDTT